MEKIFKIHETSDNKVIVKFNDFKEKKEIDIEKISDENIFNNVSFICDNDNKEDEPLENIISSEKEISKIKNEQHKEIVQKINSQYSYIISDLKNK